MGEYITIRAEQPDDIDAIRPINDAAFAQTTEVACQRL